MFYAQSTGENQRDERVNEMNWNKTRQNDIIKNLFLAVNCRWTKNPRNIPFVSVFEQPNDISSAQISPHALNFFFFFVYLVKLLFMRSITVYRLPRFPVPHSNHEVRTKIKNKKRGFVTKLATTKKSRTQTKSDFKLRQPNFITAC